MRLIALILCLFLSAPAAAELVTVAGTVRQDPNNPKVWSFVSDAAHTPVGFKPTVEANGTDLVLRFGEKFKRVVSVVAGPDETLASRYGLSVGASVNQDAIALRMSVTRSITGKVWYDKGTWRHLIQSFTGPVVAPTPTFARGNLTVRHDVVPGSGLTLTGWTRSGAAVPSIPLVRTVDGDTFDASFLGANGSLETVPSEHMSLIYNKAVSTQVRVDGGAGSGEFVLAEGNIWVIGVMER